METEAASAPGSKNDDVVRAVVTADGEGSHLTAQEIWLRARERAPRMGFATVHRALARLARSGAILKAELPGALSAVYEPPRGPHAHFRCESCGRIDDLDFRVGAEAREALAAAIGARIEGENVSFSGRCRACLGGGVNGAGGAG